MSATPDGDEFFTPDTKRQSDPVDFGSEQVAHIRSVIDILLDEMQDEGTLERYEQLDTIIRLQGLRRRIEEGV